MQRILIWSIGIIGIVVVAFLAARSAIPCNLPSVLPGVIQACQISINIDNIKSITKLDPLVTTKKASFMQFHERIFASGNFVATEEAIVGPQIDGLRIMAIYVEDGDSVAEGQVLAKLDSRQLEVLIAQSEANLKQADFAIEQAAEKIQVSEFSLLQINKDLERLTTLGPNIATQATIDKKTTEQKIAQINLSSARSALNSAIAQRASVLANQQDYKVRLARTEVRAPVSGIITKRMAQLGAIASAGGGGLFSIAKDSLVELKAEVSAEYTERLRANLPATVRVPGDYAVVMGSIRMVHSSANTNSKMSIIRVAVPHHFTLGTFGTAEITLAQRESLSVPISAIIQDKTGGTYVQVTVDNVVELRKVTTGIINGQNIEIKEGLNPQEMIVLKAAPFLQAGDKVRIKDITDNI